MKNWDNLRLVLALHRFASMVNAGRHLGVTDTTVARRIKSLSDDLGFDLFERIDNQWLITERGRSVLEHAEQIEHILEEMSSGLKSFETDIKGEVRISTLGSVIELFLAPKLPTFHAAYPGISLELSESDSRASLANRDADIALRLAQPDSGRLVAKRVASFDIGIFSGTAEGSSGWLGLSNGLDWLPEMQLCQDHFQCSPLGRLCSYRALGMAIRGTDLAAPVPNALAQELGLHPLHKQVSRPIWMAIHESRRADPVLRLTMEWLEAALLCDADGHPPTQH